MIPIRVGSAWHTRTCVFEGFGADALVGEIEASLRLESALWARRCAVIAALLAQRTGEAEDADPDAGLALITGFARTTAEVSATMNMSPMGAQHVVAQAEALDARLPAVAALLAAGRTDWRTVQVIMARSELVSDSLIGQLDQSLAERVGSWAVLVAAAPHQRRRRRGTRHRPRGRQGAAGARR
jgi:hypothetical protein